MALVFAWAFYERLPGRPWVRGLAFSQLPWAIQALVVLPWAGAGLFGLRLSPGTPLVPGMLRPIGMALRTICGCMCGPIRANPSQQVVRKQSAPPSALWAAMPMVFMV
jgi:hypothetical protein